jgi:NADP-dependent 3-hydroxy acid dehydrogenase YdfG
MNTVFVTGASSGFGRSIALRFLAGGDRVVVCARRIERMREFEREYPDRVLVVELDVTDRAAIERATAALPVQFQHVDVLVNNAGLALGLSPAHQADVEEWDRMIATNCTGLVHVTRALLPGMVERRRGTIVNIGSVAGEFPYPGGNVYGATKAFVHQFTQNLNADLIGTGVRASCVEPGLVGGTEFSTVRFGGDTARSGAVYAGTEPLSSDDIAEAVHWIAKLPARVTVNALTIMPNCQSFAGMTIKRAAQT